MVLIWWQLGGELPPERPRLAGDDYLCLNMFHEGNFYPCSLSEMLWHVCLYLLIVNVGSIGLAFMLTAGLIWCAIQVIRQIFADRLPVGESQ